MSNAVFQGETRMRSETENVAAVKLRRRGCRSVRALVSLLAVVALGISAARAEPVTDGELPNGYRACAYVTFPYGAWIDTEAAIANAQVTTRFSTTYFNDRHVFGQEGGNKNIHLSLYDNKWYWGVNGVQKNSGNVRFVGGEHDVVFGQLGTGDFLVDGARIDTGTGTASSGGRPLLIGSRSGTSNFCGDIYSFAVTNADGTAVMDLVPCVRLEDNRVGFYDRVRNRFLTSEVGRLECPKPVTYEPLDFVRFPVGGYVNTGLCPTNVEITMTYVKTSYRNDEHMFGTGGGSGSIHFSAYADVYYWGNRGERLGAQANSSGVQSWTAGRHTVVYSKNGTPNGDVVLDGVVLGGGTLENGCERGGTVLTEVLEDGAVTNQTLSGGTPTPLVIGARSWGTSYWDCANFSGDVYSFAVTNRDGIGLLDLFPCRRLPDGAYGLFDRVGNTFLPILCRPGVPVPDGDYEFLDGIHVLMGQYVDTGLVVSEPVQITMDFRSFWYLDRHFFGSTAGNKYIHFSIYDRGAGAGHQLFWGASGAQANGAANSWTDGRHKLVFNANCGGGILMDGEQVGQGVGNCNTQGKTLQLCARDSARNFEGEIYSFAVTNASGVGLLDLVPCRRTQDGEIGFYDRVGERFIEFSGDGEVGRYSADGKTFKKGIGDRKVADPTALYDLGTDYDQIDYVEFPHGAALDTGKAVSASYLGVSVPNQITMRFEENGEYENDRHVFGQRSKNWDGGYIHFSAFDNAWFWGVNNTQQDSKNLCAWSPGIHTLVYNDMTASNVVLDAQVISPATLTNANTQGTSIVLGARGTTANFAGRIYSFAVTNHFGMPQMELVPCVRCADSKIGFFDKVGGRFLTIPEFGYRNVRHGTVPDGFRRMIYLAANGAYVDTGVLPNADTQIRVTYCADDTEQNNLLFGVRDYGFPCACYLSGGINRSIDVYFGSAASGLQIIDVPSNARHELCLDAQAGRVDGIVLYANTTASGASTKSLLLFAQRDASDGGLDRRRFTGRCHRFQMFQQGELVCDLVPVQREADGTVGFYDLVRDVFLEGQGGEFLPGPDYAFGTVFFIR